MNPAAAREECLALMRALEIRPVHVEHVARLALQLFDQLGGVHQLGPRERSILEAAAWLHDIGHRSPVKEEGHHKESARMIREHSWRHLHPETVEVVAQVARYHRKSVPDLAHKDFLILDDGGREVVRRLAALLRLADALDRNHAQIIQGVVVEVEPARLVLHLKIGGPMLREMTGPIQREVMAARLKGDLAMTVFGRRLAFMVDGEELMKES